MTLIEDAASGAIEIVLKIAKDKLLTHDYLPEILAQLDREIVNKLCGEYEPLIKEKLQESWDCHVDHYGSIYRKVIHDFHDAMVNKLVSEYYQQVQSKIDLQALINATFISTVKNLAGNR